MKKLQKLNSQEITALNPGDQIYIKGSVDTVTKTLDENHIVNVRFPNDLNQECVDMDKELQLNDTVHVPFICQQVKTYRDGGFIIHGWYASGEERGQLYRFANDFASNNIEIYQEDEEPIFVIIERF